MRKHAPSAQTQSNITPTAQKNLKAGENVWVQFKFQSCGQTKPAFHKHLYKDNTISDFNVLQIYTVMSLNGSPNT